MTQPGTATPTPANVETSALVDVLDQIGMPNQVVAGAIRAMTPTMNFLGVAACVKFAPLDGGCSATQSPKDDFSAIDALAKPGVVLVMHVDGPAVGAVLGGFMTREYRRRGAAGVVTNSVIRDVTELSTLGLAVCAAGASPINGARRLRVEALQAPLSLPGANGTDVLVRPGDTIVGDADGVVVVPHEHAQDILAAARQVSTVEQAVARDMNGGMPRVQALAANDRFGHLAALREKLLPGR